jgi:cytochrome b subunit of formate dehydrogenase
LAWAVISVVVINKQDGKPTLSVETSAGREVMTALSAILAFGGIAFIHIYMGYPVFG